MSNSIDDNLPQSPMMTEQGKEELYIYSLKKMADENVVKTRIELTDLFGIKPFFFKSNEMMHNNKKNKYVLIRMDIYRFKTVNEFCGRAEGDELLKFIAGCFREYESENTLVGHLRADIFAMCMPFTSNEDAIAIVTSIKNKIDAYPMPCKALPAFGICVAHSPMDISVMCDYADLALQKVKGKAFSYYEFYDDNMRKLLLYEKKIENEIIDALNKGNIEVFVQPKVDMRTTEIIGGEALVRWNHPTEGYLFPNEFIPVLEKSGYIVDVDMYVWNEVLKKLQQWKLEGKTIKPISVNVSRVHVYQSDFKEAVINLVKKYDMPPKYLQLEITESAFAEDFNGLYESINYLQDNGFEFSMDDFGAGYSSLNMLKDEPMDEVKIDRIFLTDLDRLKSQIVVKSIITMINELNIDIIAEGVESREQAEFLMKYGCNRAQGFYYYKPMPIDVFGELLK